MTLIVILKHTYSVAGLHGCHGRGILPKVGLTHFIFPKMYPPSMCACMNWRHGIRYIISIGVQINHFILKRWFSGKKWKSRWHLKICDLLNWTKCLRNECSVEIKSSNYNETFICLKKSTISKAMNSSLFSHHWLYRPPRQMQDVFI